MSLQQLVWRHAGTHTTAFEESPLQAWLKTQIKPCSHWQGFFDPVIRLRWKPEWTAALSLGNNYNWTGGFWSLEHLRNCSILRLARLRIARLQNLRILWTLHSREERIALTESRRRNKPQILYHIYRYDKTRFDKTWLNSLCLRKGGWVEGIPIEMSLRCNKAEPPTQSKRRREA